MSKTPKNMTVEDFIDSFSSDPGLLPESMGELTDDEARAAGASVVHRNAPLRALQWVIDNLGVGVREAAALLKSSKVERAACDLHALCTSDWDDLTTSLQRPLYTAILDLLASQKDHTRIEGARLAARLVEVRAKDERKEKAARAPLLAAQAKAEGERRTQGLTDDQLAQEIASTMATLH